VVPQTALRRRGAAQPGRTGSLAVSLTPALCGLSRRATAAVSSFPATRAAFLKVRARFRFEPSQERRLTSIVLACHLVGDFVSVGGGGGRSPSTSQGTASSLTWFLFMVGSAITERAGRDGHRAGL
jgi:hypothetical protein